MWHHTYSLPYTKVPSFIACRATSKIIFIGAIERSWGDVKTIKYGNKSAIISYVSEKQSAVYKYSRIESAIVGRTDSQ